MPNKPKISGETLRELLFKPVEHPESVIISVQSGRIVTVQPAYKVNERAASSKKEPR